MQQMFMTDTLFLRERIMSSIDSKITILSSHRTPIFLIETIVFDYIAAKFLYYFT